ncbi:MULTISPECIES: M23 family metallopeptidase [unclassified Rathayibacter]|uniref:M23 family metallopeptidase n=1 Tax=unclassified Rathayibacter TaxID=2609250 RepID=UPI000F9C3A82|nr:MULTISPECIES: M23 family metallopeptidase [unclassified Rathayibacter]MCJ1702660.1 peptidoglycan DD-metalloendopeptidase family protein [Rathayibacter sp. VKM Ac-2926]ROP48589.1 murein DD-endopeptidase MepM/ murein hydrolase activator NlpD [Rathayibacter sp. PhB186]ROS49738.1 murein DD-endopeptidase MepM/ murein hydrolase activator NlpD [Rathayibacter sp. PhB185]
MIHSSRRNRPARRSGAPRIGRLRGTALVSAAVALVAGLLVATPAQAVEYPSWADVEAAKGNTQAAAAQVDSILSLIDGLQSEVAAAQQVAEQRGEEYFAAQQDFDDASDRASELEAKATASADQADAATQQAGLLAAQLYRTTGTDLSVNIFLDGEGGKADDLLGRIGNMTKLVERSNAIYEQASTTKNTAESLGDQAKVAQAEREKLRVAAESKLAEATAAQAASEAALTEQQNQSIVLEQQLAALRDTESTTVADYEAGVAAREAERQRILAEQEAARQAQAELARQRAAAAREAAAAAAAAAPSRGSGGGGGYSAPVAPSPGGGSTAVSDSGWVLPASGRITGTFGPRGSLSTGGGSTSSYHRGTDIAGGCGIPIFAAHSGTVTYAGWFGTYGNWIEISNGDGISTGYAHIMPGGIYVSVGQRVEAGQQIAAVGTTGASTGCHLHYETRVNGTAVDAQPFMAARGVTLG